MKTVFLLVFVALCFSSVEKINPTLFAEFTRNKENDFVVMLKNSDYKNLKHNGQDFESLDIETKAHFIVDTLISHAKDTQKDITSFLKEKKAKFSTMWIINAVTVYKGSIELAKELADRSDVERVVFNQKYEISPLEKSFPAEKTQSRVEWNLEFVDAHKVWEKNVTGNGIIVGHVDT